MKKKRPYSDYLTADLERLYNENKHDQDKVGEILHELIHRTESKAVPSLNARPKKSLDQIRSRHLRAYEPWKAAEDETLIRAYELGTPVKAIAEQFKRQPSAIRSRLRKLECLPKDKKTKESPDASSKPTQEKELEIPKQFVEKNQSGTSEELVDATPESGDQVFDEMASDKKIFEKPHKVTHVRAIGEAPGAPRKWLPDKKQYVTLNVDSNASLVDRMIAALYSLIEDMKRTGQGSMRIHLTDGSKYLLDGDIPCYEFKCDTENEIQEGLEIIAVVGNKRIPGTILSVSSEKVLVRFENPPDVAITSCTIEINRTSLLKSLKKALERVNSDKPEWFNSDLALKAITGADIKDIKKPFNGTFKENLNSSQQEALKKGLNKEISFIWGPPGTGKTLTLGELVRILYGQKKKVLVCSNTNQAVDQLLLKLCQVLGRQHPAMEDGHVVRIGKIEHEELESDWGEYVRLEDIIERKGAKLTLRRTTLEEEKATILANTESIRKVHRDFLTLDKAEIAQRKIAEGNKRVGANLQKQVQERDKLESNFKQKLTKNENQLEALEQKKKGFELEKKKRSEAFWKFKYRSEDEIEKSIRENEREANDIQIEIIEAPKKNETKRNQLDKKISKLQREYDLLKVKSNDNQKERNLLKENLKEHVREEIEKEITKTEKKIAAIEKKVSEINAELKGLKESIAKGSKILGATVTKTHLSPELFRGIDTVIIDEASMVLLPAAFYSAGLAKTSLVISGDYLQLSPIVGTEQKTILNEIGKNIFKSSGVQDQCEKRHKSDIVTLLDTQYRMKKTICDLISEPFYQNQLLTDRPEVSEESYHGELIKGEITIIDTSSRNPIENKSMGSRYNLMHGLVVRNLVRHLGQSGYLDSRHRLGLCTPFKAQANLLRSIIASEGLAGVVRAGTVHRYQGDEKETIVLDIPNGWGGGGVGLFLQADSQIDDGAKLFNVALSRAKNHLVLVANLTHLDKRLPNKAVLRGIINKAQKTGAVVDVNQILGLESIKDELVGVALPVQDEVIQAKDMVPVLDEVIQAKDTVPVLDEVMQAKDSAPVLDEVSQVKDSFFRQDEFDALFRLDLLRARKTVAIFSGFVTMRRVSTYSNLFQRKLSEGVQIRCITRPPGQNKQEHMRRSAKEALDLLEEIGCVVDTRLRIHEKVVIIDDSIVWFGSLNPLSHTQETDEIMNRLEGEAIALEVVRFMSLKPIKDVESARGVSVKKENPPCPECGSRTVLGKGVFVCEKDSKHRTSSAPFRSKRRNKKIGRMELDKMRLNPIDCPKGCGSMTIQNGKYGPFWRCRKCKTTKNINSND